MTSQGWGRGGGGGGRELQEQTEVVCVPCAVLCVGVSLSY